MLWPARYTLALFSNKFILISYFVSRAICPPTICIFAAESAVLTVDNPTFRQTTEIALIICDGAGASRELQRHNVPKNTVTDMG